MFCGLSVSSLNLKCSHYPDAWFLWCYPRLLFHLLNLRIYRARTLTTLLSPICHKSFNAPKKITLIRNAVVQLDYSATAVKTHSVPYAGEGITSLALERFMVDRRYRHFKGKGFHHPLRRVDKHYHFGVFAHIAVLLKVMR